MPVKIIIVLLLIVLAAVISAILWDRGNALSGGGHMLGGLPGAFAVIGIAAVIALVISIIVIVILGWKKSLIILGSAAAIAALIGVFFWAKSLINAYLEDREYYAYRTKLTNIVKLSLDDLLGRARASWEIDDHNEYSAVFEALSIRDEKDRILPVFVKLIEESPAKENSRRFPLGEGLGSIGEQAVSYVENFSSSPKADIRWYAALASGKLIFSGQKERILKVLETLINDADEGVAQMALSSLLELGDEALPYAQKLRDDKREWVRLRLDNYYLQRGGKK